MPRSPEELYELKQQLVKMREEGLTTLQIANKLNITRDQASGLISRLIRGYKSKKKPQLSGYKVVSNDFVPPTSGARPRPSQPVSIEGLPIVSTDLSFEPPPGKVSIWNIRTAQCRWIDDEGFFCATPTGNPSKSYCAHHEKICFNQQYTRVRRNVSAFSPVNS